MRRTVQDPEGATWTVGRRWLEGLHLPRWRGRDPGLDGLDAAGALADAGPLAILGLLLAAVALLLLLAFVALPLLFFGAELVVVLVVALAGLLGRLVLGHPWLVQARTGGRVVTSRRVAGWRASREAVRQLHEEVAAGRVSALEAAAEPAAAPAPVATPAPVVADAGPGDTELRLRAAIAGLLALLWLAGVGSLVALLVASSVLERSCERGTRAVAWVAIALGFLGIVLTILLAIGIANESIRLT